MAWWCETHAGWTAGKNGGFWIGLEILAENKVDVDALPVKEIAASPRCTRCGERGAELHHWAPRALFCDAEYWPKDYLCKECHKVWHDRVTPNLRHQCLTQNK